MNITHGLLASLLLTVSVWNGFALTPPAQSDIDALKARLEQQESVKDRYRLGVMYSLTGQWDAAIESWRRILSNKQAGLPRASKLRLVRSIAIAHLKAGRVEKAWHWIELAYKRQPDDPRLIAARDMIAAERDKLQPPPGAPPASPSPSAPPPPTYTAAQIKAAFDAGEQAYTEGLVLVEQATDPAVPEAKFTAAIKELEVAALGDARKPRTLFFLGSAHLMRNDDAAKDLEVARDRLEESLKLDEDKATLMNLAQVYGLLDQGEKQIELLERVIAIDDKAAEAHFRLAMAYDKSGRKDAPSKTFENAKAAIRLNAEYKKRFQGVLKNSKVANDVAELVGKIIDESANDTLDDRKTEAYAKLFQEMFGADGNIRPGALKNPESLKKLLGTVEGHQLMESPQGKKLQEFMKTPEGKVLQDRVLKKYAPSAAPGAAPATH